MKSHNHLDYKFRHVTPMLDVPSEIMLGLLSLEPGYAKKQAAVDRAVVYMKELHARNSEKTITLEEKEKQAWHYTGAINLFRIMAANTLPASEDLQLPFLPFSKNAIWDPLAGRVADLDANVIWLLNKACANVQGNGLIRFGYPETALVSWKDSCLLANISASTARKFESAAFSSGIGAYQWLGSFLDIPASKLTIEYLDNGKWIRLQDPFVDQITDNQAVEAMQ